MDGTEVLKQFATFPGTLGDIAGNLNRLKIELYTPTENLPARNDFRDLEN